jgi:hypothetical protein
MRCSKIFRASFQTLLPLFTPAELTRLTLMGLAQLPFHLQDWSPGLPCSTSLPAYPHPPWPRQALLPWQTWDTVAHCHARHRGLSGDVVALAGVQAHAYVQLEGRAEGLRLACRRGLGPGGVVGLGAPLAPVLATRNEVADRVVAHPPSSQ